MILLYPKDIIKIIFLSKFFSDNSFCPKHFTLIFCDLINLVNVASLAGKKGVVLGAPYAAAKHGVLGLTKTAALEYGQHGIRVNAVCPSFLETDIIQPVPDKVLDFVKNHRVPLKRLGLPEEAANTIAWLLSDQSSFVNGHGLTMDGGMSVG